GPVFVFLLIALGAYLYIRARETVTGGALGRAVDHAWTQLVPKLHTDGFNPEHAAFLAALAEASLGCGRPAGRRRQLERVIELTEQAVLAGTGSAAHLAALWRLDPLDAAAAGNDPVTLVGRQLSRCLEGPLPLALAEQLLAHWQSDWWTAGNVARL